jgi:hypothetical protein
MFKVVFSCLAESPVNMANLNQFDGRIWRSRKGATSMKISAREAFDFVRDVAKNKESNYAAMATIALCSVLCLLPDGQPGMAWLLGATAISGLTAKTAVGSVLVAAGNSPAFAPK